MTERRRRPIEVVPAVGPGCGRGAGSGDHRQSTAPLSITRRDPYVAFVIYLSQAELQPSTEEGINLPGTCTACCCVAYGVGWAAAP